MSERKTIPDLTKLATAVREAEEVYAAAEREEKEADRKKSRARESLNQAQIALDQATKAFREAAPWDTHWHNQQRSRDHGEKASV